MKVLRNNLGTKPCWNELIYMQVGTSQSEPSAADLAEREQSAAARIAALHQPVALGLDAQGLAHQRLDGLTPAQRVAQVGLQIAEQAGAQLAVGRQAHTVAAAAVVVAHGG